MAASAGRVLLIPKGTYNAATTYNMLDVVYYDGATYVCKQTSLGNLPTDTDYWQLMASSSGTAAQVSFDPTGTGLVATNVQNAVVEVKNNISNPNLLINPWFTVNQRGFSSETITSEKYTVDRWIATGQSGSSGTFAKTSSGFSITASSANSAYIQQRFEDTAFLNGKTVTMSVMFSDGTIKSGTAVIDTSASANLYDDSDITLRHSASVKAFQFTVKTGKTKVIKALKLELGTISTLALDTAPDYTTELLKCQRYFVRIESSNASTPLLKGYGMASGTTVRVSASLLTPLRIVTPTITFSGTINVIGNGKSKLMTSIDSVQNGSKNAQPFTVVSSEITQFQLYELVGESNAYIDINAEL